MRINVILLILVTLLFSCDSGDGSSPTTTGKGGSMTRFAIQGDYMYVVDNNSLQTYSITEGVFTELNSSELDAGIETIFCKGEYLYLGATDAMYIFSISDPQAPLFLFQYTHIVSCDPVVVQGNRAYVTMNAGNSCGSTTSQLQIIDISDPTYPILKYTYNMLTPQGLSIDGNLLFVCNGEFGLSIWDVSKEDDIQLIDEYSIYAYDVITKDGIATVTGKDGIFQYSYTSSGSEIRLLSKIPVVI